MLTKDKLTNDLKRFNAPEWMIHLAQHGHYDDYESNLAKPIHQLVTDCKLMMKQNAEKYAELRHIVVKALNGAYDGTPEEGKDWFNREGYKYI